MRMRGAGVLLLASAEGCMAVISEVPDSSVLHWEPVPGSFGGSGGVTGTAGGGQSLRY